MHFTYEYKHFHLSSSFIYKLSFSAMSSTQSTDEEVEQEISKSPDPSPMLHRSFSHLSEPPANALTVLQWNILAQGLTRGNIANLSERVIDWERRRWYILREILRFKADIVCLNEVDCFQFIQSHLCQYGYEGHFLPKPRSPCLLMPDNFGPDGTAIFVRNNKVEPLEVTDLHLEEHSSAKVDIRGAQVAVLWKLREKATGKLLCVAATHLKAKEHCFRLRVLQTEALLEKLIDLVPSHVPLILCGDFNGESFEEYYRLISNSQLSLKSAYKEAYGKEPGFTTRKIVFGDNSTTKEVARAIDYIWFRGMNLHATLDIPKPTDFDPLPTLSFPSDHLSICAILSSS